jgi:hypothetical protein
MPAIANDVIKRNPVRNGAQAEYSLTTDSSRSYDKALKIEKLGLQMGV